MTKSLITRTINYRWNKYCVDVSLPINVIQDRYNAGDSIDFLVEDYGITREQVLVVINFRRKDKIK